MPGPRGLTLTPVRCGHGTVPGSSRTQPVQLPIADNRAVGPIKIGPSKRDPIIGSSATVRRTAGCVGSFGNLNFGKSLSGVSAA
eukprot:767469-Hanusia_phi.AAC.2